MTTLNADHPAVEAMLWHDGQYNYAEAPENWPPRRRTFVALDYRDKLEHALPHLESATPENLERLRYSPAGQALMAEAWHQGRRDRQNDYGAADTTPCPYKETPRD